MNYTLTQNNLHIEESYKISKSEFVPFFNDLRKKEPWSDVWNRTNGSMKREWASHNLLYNLHLFRSHTKDVDLNYPQKWYVSLAYNIFGFFALFFIA